MRVRGGTPPRSRDWRGRSTELAQHHDGAEYVVVEDPGTLRGVLDHRRLEAWADVGASRGIVDLGVRVVVVEAEHGERLIDRVVQIWDLFHAGVLTLIIRDLAPCLDNSGDVVLQQNCPEIIERLERQRDVLTTYIDAVRTTILTRTELLGARTHVWGQCPIMLTMGRGEWPSVPR